MAEDTKRRAFKMVSPPPGMEVVGPVKQIHLRLNVGPLDVVEVYYDPLEKNQPEHKRGLVHFFPTSWHRPVAQLVYSWFPQGTWKIKLTEPDQSGAIYASSIELDESKEDRAVLEAFQERAKSLGLAIGWEFKKIPDPTRNIAMQKAEVTEAVRCAAEKGHEVLLKVAYAPEDGDTRAHSKAEPLHGYPKYLLDEKLAHVFLEFVEHFGNMEVDYGLAKGGLTEEKLERVSAPSPSVVKAITDLFTQGYGEFEWAQGSAKPMPGLDDFKRMEEAIFFQARAKNDLARRNMLRIDIGFLQDKHGKRTDIGVVRRPCADGVAREGEPRWLLYDRHGIAMPSGGGFKDMEYRSVDLEKLKREAAFPVLLPNTWVLFVMRGVPIVEIDVQDRNIYTFLRVLEQNFGGPPRELVALAASLFNYGAFIAQEMYKRSKPAVAAGRTIEFAVGVFLFFVVHAMAASFLASPSPTAQAAGYLLMAMAHAVGAILGVDLALTNMEKLALAGRHFAQMERLHREGAGSEGRSEAGQTDQRPVDIPRQQEPRLTELSEEHLADGSEALLDAMADYFAFGVVLVGGLGVAKLRKMRVEAKEAKAIAEHIKEFEEAARSRLKVDDEGRVEEIEPLKAADKLEEVPAPRQGRPSKPAGGLGLEKPPADGKPKLEKKKPIYGEYFYKRCDSLKKRVEVLKEHLDGLEKPPDAGCAQKLDELRATRTMYLLNSIELMRRSKGERLIPVIAKEVAEFEADVAKEFSPPKAEEPPRDSEGLYVIQEPGELQGEPQNGKAPRQVAGAKIGQGPKIWTREVDTDPRVFTFLDINPGFPGPGRTENCVNCAVALDRTLGGRPSVAEPSDYGFPLSDLESEMKGRFVKTDLPSLQADLIAAGKGARGIVAVHSLASDLGHVFNVVNMDGKIRFIDSQVGAVYDEPDEYFYNWHFMRTDNL